MLHHEDLNGWVAAALGPGVHVTRRRRLNRQSEVIVERCGVEGWRSPTVIAKYVTNGVETPVGFDEERLHYQFLAGVGFRRCPKVLAWTPRLLVLEDLPADPDPGEDAYGRAFATTLADLHSRTTGRYADYTSLRGATGNLPEANNSLADDLPARVRSGVEAVQGYALVFGIPWAALTQAAEQAIASVERPDPMWCSLLHDEPASRRQAVLSHGTLKLIDFERARYGHRFMDLAWILAGQLQWQREPEGYFLRVGTAGEDFLPTYARVSTDLGKPLPPGASEQLAHAILYATLHNIALLLEISAALPGATAPTDVLHQALARAGALLEVGPVFAAAETLVALARHVGVPPGIAGRTFG